MAVFAWLPKQTGVALSSDGRARGNKGGLAPYLRRAASTTNSSSENRAALKASQRIFCLRLEDLLTGAFVTPTIRSPKPITTLTPDSPMKTVALVAPSFQANTLRYLRALADLEDCRALVISQDSAERLPAELRGRLGGHFRVGNCLDGRALAGACKAFQRQFGQLDALFGVLEQLQLPIAAARELAGVPGMGVRVTEAFRDKARMKDVLRAAAVPVARHARVESASDALALAEATGLPLILKPVDGLGSRGIQRIGTQVELLAALEACKPSAQAPMQAEEFVVGTEQTFETVSIAGQPVWSSGTYYLNRPLEVLEHPWMQYCVLLPREEALPAFQAFQPTNHAALQALGMGTGLTHMEWFLREDGSHVVSEVGARPPGVHIMPLMSLAYEQDFIALWTRLMVHQTWPKNLVRKWATGAAFFRAQGRGRRVAEVRGVAQAWAQVGHLVVESHLPRVGQARVASYEGEGYAIVRAADTSAVRDALRTLVTHVQIRCA